MVQCFLVGVQPACGLSPAGYGVYAFDMSVTVILGVPTEFGRPPLITRGVATANVHQAWSGVRGFMVFSSALLATTSLLPAAIGEILFSTTDILADPGKRSMLIWGLLPILIVAQTKLCGAVPTLMFACASNIVYAVFGPVERCLM